MAGVPNTDCPQNAIPLIKQEPEEPTDDSDTNEVSDCLLFI